MGFSTGLSGSDQVRNREESPWKTGRERASRKDRMGLAVGPSGERHLAYAVQKTSVCFTGKIGQAVVRHGPTLRDVEVIVKPKAISNSYAFISQAFTMAR